MEADEKPTPAPRPAPAAPQGPAAGRFGLSGAAKRLLRPLANLKLAIGELGAIAALSSIGTVIEQNKPYAYYVANYPNEGEKVAGFVTADVIWALQWDHIYTADYFLGLLALLAASLAACTATTQWPMVKVAQRWRFRREPSSFTNLPLARRVPSARLPDLAAALDNKGYQLFVQNGALYGFKGLAGKIGPIGVHASMLLTMAGIVIGALGGYSGTAMIPEGGDALVSTLLRPASPLARLPEGGQAVLHVDDFRIEYRSDGSIKQFYTDIAVEDIDGARRAAKTISVNQPLRFGGITAYQTDWSMAALTLRAPGSPLSPPGDTAVNLPMASLEGQPGVSGTLYAAFLPIDDPDVAERQGQAPKGISFLARDLQAVTVYDSSGQFVGVRRPGSGKPLEVEGIKVVIDDIVTSSGMELKVDPGVPFVYAGFGGMCITTVVSYLSHSQLWATQIGSDVVVGGRSNRAKVGFDKEIEGVLESLPEAGAPLQH
jgi:cytochrome c biogenesis protein